MDWKPIAFSAAILLIPIILTLVLKWLITEKKLSRTTVEIIDAVIDDIIAKQRAGELNIGMSAFQILLAFDQAVNNSLGKVPAPIATPSVQDKVANSIATAITISGADEKTMQRQIRAKVKDQLESIGEKLLSSKSAQRKARQIVTGLVKKIDF